MLYLLALGIVPALAIVLGVYWLFGREPKTGYDREYEQEPPTDTQPALVPTLLRQGGEAGSFEFTATLFDLIRRGVFTSKPVTTERSTWGGLRKEEMSDLEISAGAPDAMTNYEQDVAAVVNGVIGSGSERLSNFREQITAHRATMSTRFTSFKSDVASEVKQPPLVPRPRGRAARPGGAPLHRARDRLLARRSLPLAPRVCPLE